MKQQKILKNLLPPDLTKILTTLENAGLDGKVLMELAHQWYSFAVVCQKIGAMLEKRGKEKLYFSDGTLYAITISDDDSAAEHCQEV